MKIKPFLPAIFWLAIVTFLSVTSNLQVPKIKLFSADKLGHAAAYGLLVWLLAWAIWKSKNRGLSRWEMFFIFCFAAAFGVLMEWVQGTFFSNRFFEYDDMLANAAGAFIAVMLTHPLYKILGPKSND